MDRSIDKVINFYVDRNPMDWFKTPKGLDEELRTRFSDLVADARSSKLESWRQHAKGSLAMIILLDQIPRNIFRESGESFSSDPKALEIATDSVAQGFDQEIGKENRIAQYLFYMPFEHAENMLAQIAGLNLLKNLASACDDGTKSKEFCTYGIQFSQQHLDVIAKFGRFPKRNIPLGRKSTTQEEEFLKEHPGGL